MRTARETRQFLVSRRSDGWLTGGFAVALWLVAKLSSLAGQPISQLARSWYWPAALVSAAHFGMSYRLAYGHKAAEARTRRVPLIVAPATLAVVLIGIAGVALALGERAVHPTTAAFVSLVYLLTTWHYVKQVYGVVRVGARYRGISLTPREASILRYGLYPMWYLGAARIFVKSSGARFGQYQLGLQLLPHWTVNVARAAAVAGGLGIGWVIYGVSKRHSVRPPALMVAPNVAAFLWLLVPADFATLTLALGALHAVQYLACCSRVELSRVETSRVETAGATSLLTPTRWFEMLGGAACGGFLLSNWLPSVLGRVFDRPALPLMFAALFFVFLNLHHYIIDAVVWRSSGDVVRSIARPAVVVPALAAASAR